MLPFGMTIPATVSQRSEIPDLLLNNPVCVGKLICTLGTGKILPRRRLNLIKFSALYSQYERKHMWCYLLQADWNMSICYYQALLSIINVLCSSGNFLWTKRSISLYISISCNLSPNSLFYILLSSSHSLPTSQFPRSFSPSSFAHVTLIHSS